MADFFGVNHTLSLLDSQESNHGAGSASFSLATAQLLRDCEIAVFIRLRRWRMSYITFSEFPSPRGKLKQDAIRIKEIDGTHERTVIYRRVDLPWGIIVVNHLGHFNTLGA
jgi:hypothetical protein